MIGASPLFAQENQNERKGWDGVIKGGISSTSKCPDYLDCSTGQIKYFEYKQDFTIDATEVCGPLGVKSCVILKGRYEVDRSSKNGAVVTLACKKITFPPNKAFKIDSTNPKGKDCEGFGNSCWYVNSAENKEEKFPIVITPIFEKEVLVAIQLQYPSSGKGSGSPKNAGF